MSLTHTTIRALSLTMLVFGLTPGVAFADPPTRWRNNGAFVYVDISDGSCLSMSIHASRSGTRQNPQTFLYYFAWDGCAGQMLAAGQGFIPNSAFKVEKGVATLAVTPQPSATFSAEGALGAIKLTVTPNGVYSSTFSGHSEYTYPGHVLRTHGSAWHKLATASATTMVGSFESREASFGESRDNYMEIERLSK